MESGIFGVQRQVDPAYTPKSSLAVQLESAPHCRPGQVPANHTGCQQTTRAVQKEGIITASYNCNSAPQIEVFAKTEKMTTANDTNHPRPVLAVGIIGMGDMGKLYARRIAAAGWRFVPTSKVPTKN